MLSISSFFEGKCKEKKKSLSAKTKDDVPLLRASGQNFVKFDVVYFKILEPK